MKPADRSEHLDKKGSAVTFPTRQDVGIHKRAAAHLRKKEAKLDVEKRSIRTPEAVADALLGAVTKEYRGGHSAIELPLKLQMSNFTDWAIRRRLIDDTMSLPERSENMRKVLQKDTWTLVKSQLADGTFGKLSCRKASGGTFVFDIQIIVLKPPTKE